MTGSNDADKDGVARSGVSGLHAAPTMRSDAFNLLLLESTPWGVVTLDHRRHVVSTNGRGRKAIARGDGLRIESGRLRALGSADDRSLQIAIELCLKSVGGEGTYAGSAVAVGRRGAPIPYGLRVLPIPREAEASSDPAPCVLVLIADPAQPGLPSRDDLVVIFGLTPREAEVTLLIAQTLSLAEAADRLGISRNTARTHLVNAMVKTGARNQVALVALIRGLPIGET